MTFKSGATTFANSLASGSENLNELESHLRDSIATLQTRGLSAEEGFLIATRRLGQGQEIIEKLARGQFTFLNLLNTIKRGRIAPASLD